LGPRDFAPLRRLASTRALLLRSGAGVRAQLSGSVARMRAQLSGSVARMRARRARCSVMVIASLAACREQAEKTGPLADPSAAIYIIVGIFSMIP
jgi:hypothetical protein